ncbi:MAG TPA: ABC-F type ribosomal protection protein [Fusibacter sp.]|nr:ABC-F type ribosomal protection protein [Fusibacter sp.]
MFELSFNHIMKYMGTHLLFKEMNFQVFSGERVGIVGPNGCGKSTILKLIAGIEPLNIYIGSWSVGYDFGWIYKPKDVTVAYLDQMPKYPENFAVKDVLMDAFKDILDVERQMRALEHDMAILDGVALERAINRYAHVTARFEAMSGYDIEEKFSKICTGLQFDARFLDMPFNLLSGGEQTNVILGKILLDKPDILLLDEPTNHLDTSAIEWLESYLNTFGGIMIIVSHDRYFLDKVVTKIIEIEDMQAQAFKGNYSSYVAQKEEQMRIQYADYQEQRKQIKQMETKVKQLRDWALRADNNKFFRRAASMQIKLEKMAQVKRPVFDKPNMKLDLSSSSRSGEEALICRNITKRFDERAIFHDANLTIKYGERAALIGPNGSGKSTLLKMLLGELPADSGELKIGSNAKIAYLPQQIAFPNEDLSLVECFREGLDISEGKAREHLAKFMFYGKRVYTDVKALSGGERTRLKLARLLYEDVNLLILDEPTNHLDIDSIETLEEALEDFEGTMLFISHDRYFINKVKPMVVAVEGQKLVKYLGDYDYYRQVIDKS